MKDLIVTVGLPGSGKTSWAEWYQEQWGPDKVVLVSRDDMRELLHRGHHDYPGNLEEIVTAACHSLVEKLLTMGKNVVVHDMNLRMAYRKRWAEIADRAGARYVQMDFSSVDLETCQDRDAARENPVGREYIANMHDRYIRSHKGKPLPEPVSRDRVEGQWFAPYEADWKLFKAILVDVDGTVARMTNRGPHDYHRVMEDMPREDVIATIQDLHFESGYDVIFLSGRPESCREDTEEWLWQNVRVPVGKVYMRRTGDFRPDFVVKNELFETHVAGKYNIRAVFDDRNQVVEMWRKKGLNVYQVAEGNF